MSEEIYTEANNQLLVFRLDLQENEIQSLRAELSNLKDHFTENEEKRNAQERRQFLAGIAFLGSIIFTLLGFIWSNRSIIFKGDL